MSLHTWGDYKLELYDKDRVLVSDHLDQAIGLRWEKELYGRGNFSFSLPLASDAAQIIAHEALHFVRIWRGAQEESLLDGVIFKPSWKRASKSDQYLEIAGASLASIARWRSAVPLDPGPPAVPIEVTDYIDDAMKWIVEHTIGASAPTVAGGSSRVIPNLVVDTPVAAHPTLAKLTFATRPKYTLWDFLLEFGAHYGVDWDFRFNANMDIVFYTYYPRRGADRTETNSDGNTPVLMNDAAENLSGWSFYWDAGEAANVVISRKCDEEHEDAAAVAAWWRREIISESSDDATNEAALTDNAVKIGYAQEFVESAEVCFEDGPAGCVFFVGDELTNNNIQEDYGPKDETVAKVLGQIQADGVEVLGVVFGDPEPNILDKSSGGGAVTGDDSYEDLSDEDPEPVANVAAAGTLEKFSRQDHKHDLNLIADDSAAMPLTAGLGYVAGEDGISTRVDGGKLWISGQGLWDGIGFYSDTPDIVGALDANHQFGIVGGAGCSTEILQAPDNTYVTINTVWDRNADDGVLYPATIADKVSIGTTDAPLGASTKLYVNGDIEVESTLKAYSGRLYLSGQDGTIDCYTDDTATTFNVDDGDGVAQIGLLATGTSYFSGGNLIVQNSKNFETYADTEGATMTSQLAGASGNFWLVTTATTHFGGYYYTWPTDGAVTGEALTATVSGANITLAWTAPSAAAHNLLSATHGDALADTVVAGDVIIGNATPKWARLAIAVPAANVRNVLGIDNGETLPSWKTALDATAPTTIAESAVAAAGTSLVFAHRDHTHGAPATWTATAHNLFSAIHGDTTGAASPVDGDIIIGNVTPKWSKLAISVPAANVRNVLGVDNGETRPSWKTALDATNPATLTAAAAAAPGTSLVFAHRDHVHPITTTVTGAASTILATDASGYSRLVRLEIYSDAKYLWRQGTALVHESDGYHTLAIGGAGIVVVSASALYPGVDSATTCGTTDYRWLNGYFDALVVTAGGAVTFGGDTNLYRSAANVLKTDDALYVTGQITAASGATSIACSGDITLAATKTVDGVDISAWKTAYDAHTHNYIKPVQYHAAGYDADVVTGEGVQTGSYSYYECDYNSTGSVQYYVYTATDSSGTSAAWRRIYFPSKPHYHNVSYDTVASAAP